MLNIGKDKAGKAVQPETKKKNNINSYFSDCVTLKGDMKFAGSVRVDGKISGNLDCDSTIFAGKYSDISAEIETGSLVCEGRVTGNVFAHDHINITEIGKLKGTVKTPDFTIDEQGFFEGSCQVLKPKPLARKFFQKAPRRPIPVLDT